MLIIVAPPASSLCLRGGDDDGGHSPFLAFQPRGENKDTFALRPFRCHSRGIAATGGFIAPALRCTYSSGLDLCQSTGSPCADIRKQQAEQHFLFHHPNAIRGPDGRPTDRFHLRLNCFGLVCCPSHRLWLLGHAPCGIPGWQFLPLQQ